MNEFSLFRREYGKGFPLILLHGNGEDGSYFANQFGPFSEKHRVIAFDTRGHGKTLRGNAPFCFDIFADDLKRELDRLDISHCDILGFSDGGNIALVFALKYPEYVRRLVLNGADLYPSGVKLSVQIPIVLGWFFCRLISLFDKRAVSKFEMLNLMVTQPHINGDDLKKIAVPVLVIAGTEDMIRESHTKKIAALLPDSTLRFIAGSHFIAAENPAEFNEAVLNFLEGEE